MATKQNLVDMTLFWRTFSLAIQANIHIAITEIMAPVWEMEPKYDRVASSGNQRIIWVDRPRVNVTDKPFSDDQETDWLIDLLVSVRYGVLPFVHNGIFRIFY